MATELLYLQGFDVVTCQAQVTQIDKTDDGRVDLDADSFITDLISTFTKRPSTGAYLSYLV